jgi:membrane-bound lytic murein transglycosylase D
MAGGPAAACYSRRTLTGSRESVVSRAACAAVIGLAGVVSACAHGPRPQLAAVAPAPLASAAPAPSDPSLAIIARADAHLATGRAEAREGHINRAREEFDRAVDAYLTAPGGAFSNPRLAERYQQTLESVGAWEAEALAQGDGFTERRPEPAPIDEMGPLTADLGSELAPPNEDLRRTTEEAVQAEANDFPVELNDQVLACIDLYTGRLRDWFSGALARGGRYLPRIREIFQAEGVPQDLAYLAMVESAFRPTALSRAKARGVWQFIPATGKRYGLEQDWWVDERSDPEKATQAAARYLKQLHTMFGDWNLAMAGYNAGEFTVSKGLQRYQATDFWQLARTRALRRETKNYVPLIHAAIVVAKAPDKYGFDVQPETTPAFETVTVEGAYDLRLLAECAGGSLEQIQSLNPALRRLATPATRRYDLRVPEGSAAAVRTCIDSTPAERRVRFRAHTVARGETLSSIASRYGIRVSDMASANNIPTSKRLSIGTELIIPIDPRTPAVASREPAATSPSTTVVSGPNGTAKIAYRIRPGDTLGTIASQYGTTIRDLQTWNGLRSTRIVAGDTLTIFATSGF